MDNKPLEGEYIPKSAVMLDDPSIGFAYFKESTITKEKSDELNDNFFGWLFLVAFLGMIIFFLSCLPK